MNTLDRLFEHWGCRSSATNRSSLLVPAAVMERLAALALGRNLLSEEEYLALNPDVAEAVKSRVIGSGLQHMIWEGMREARPLPEPVVDPAEYARLNPDLAAQGVDTPEALVDHWLSVGWIEGRKRAD